MAVCISHPTMRQEPALGEINRCLYVQCKSFPAKLTNSTANNLYTQDAGTNFLLYQFYPIISSFLPPLELAASRWSSSGAFVYNYQVNI
ncbi:hypothetical protein M413DRAFT_289232 [Hebeloma cylindrosporum]|uniref:Uncharacterized protein n=1 Tax=Hebeloma cylindrosporum TaxID=76867 RepID=A0A0C2XF56_HEBCY|nr:hypothetical protein M413DRAFT_289232 [Hebeloma cylindrosporum h7]